MHQTNMLYSLSLNRMLSFWLWRSKLPCCGGDHMIGNSKHLLGTEFHTPTITKNQTLPSTNETGRAGDPANLQQEKRPTETER